MNSPFQNHSLEKRRAKKKEVCAAFKKEYLSIKIFSVTRINSYQKYDISHFWVYLGKY